MILAAERRKWNDSHADCYQYFCMPGYGTANGRLQFRAVHGEHVCSHAGGQYGHDELDGPSLRGLDPTQRQVPEDVAEGGADHSHEEGETEAVRRRLDG